MYDRDLDFNFIDEKNNVKIVSFSSSHKNCSPKNILNEDLKLIWLSEKEVPQSIIIDISNIYKKPKNNQFNFFGVHLWHAYQSNPKEIELSFSIDNKDFILVGIYELELRPGTQFFKIENNFYPHNLVNFLKITITKTYGGFKTYINQIFLLETLNQYGNNILDDQENIDNEEIEEIEDDKKYINDYYKLRNKINKNYAQDIKNKQKDLEKILNSYKIINKVRENNFNPRVKLMKKKISINTLTSHNSINTKNEIEQNVNKNYLINENTSYPSFSISNYKSFDSTNQTSGKIKNTLEKIPKNSLKELLDFKLKDMNDFIKTIGGELNYSTDRIRIKNPSYMKTPSIFDNQQNINLNNIDSNNFLSYKVENIEKKVNKIKNDVNDIKSVVYKMNNEINEIPIDSKYDYYENEFLKNKNRVNINRTNISDEEPSYNNNDIENYKNKINNKINKNINFYNDSYIQNFDNKLSKKLNRLSNNIENQIYRNFIEPSINEFNKKMRNSLFEMKKQIESINDINKKKFKKNYNNKEISSDSSSNYNYKRKTSNFDSSNYSLKKENILQKKYEKITALSNRLYKKLCEKEKILNDKANYLKEELKNSNNINTYYSTNTF